MERVASPDIHRYGVEGSKTRFQMLRTERFSPAIDRDISIVA